MSMHKKPLTFLEEQGLRAHHLPIGTPSQLADAFRHGVAWALKSFATDEMYRALQNIDTWAVMLPTFEVIHEGEVEAATLNIVEAIKKATARLTWHSIETAPKDKVILLFNAVTGVYTGKWNEEYKTWPMFGWDGLTGMWFPNPTHWTLIPDPPKE